MGEGDARYRQFVDASTDCMKELDRDGVIRFVAGKGCATLATEGMEGLIGRRWIDLWPGETHAMVGRMLERAAAGERVEFVASRQTAAGGARWWDVTVAPAIIGDVPDRFLVISRDVTERVQLQMALESINELLQERLNESVARSASASTRYGTLLEQLESEHGARRDAENRIDSLAGQLAMANRARDLAEAAMNQVQKQHAIGQLVSGIAHDFNNMLQTVIVSLSGLQDEADALSSHQRRMLNYAMEGTRHATALTRRLLAFARNQPERAESIDLGEVVSGFVDFARHAMNGRVGIDVLRQPGMLPVWADRHHLEQALMNVCLNARDAMEGMGQIVIEVGERHGRAGDLRPGQAALDQVFVSVADSGGGMVEEVRERLFEPYFTTKEGGSGLGLSQVYGMAAQAGGGVEIESEAGVGTRVRLVFPRYAGPLE